MADEANAYIHAVADGAAYAPGGPVLFVFHGTGGNESQFLTWGAELFPEARIIAPRGDVSENGAPRFFRRTGEGRYDFEDLATRTRQMVAFVRAHVEASTPSVVAGLGYSNGANILASVIDKAPGLFGQAILMHPLVTWDLGDAKDLTETRVLMTAGGRDPICPPDMTGKLAEMLEARGAKVDIHWHAGGHEISQDEIEAIANRFGDMRAGLTPLDSLAIRHEEQGRKGRYVLGVEGGPVAEMSYSMAGPERMIIDHTDVPDAYRGQGAGVMLLHKLVEDARAKNVKIVPLCPFANAQFRRHPGDYEDVMDKSVKVKRLSRSG